MKPGEVAFTAAILSLIILFMCFMAAPGWAGVTVRGLAEIVREGIGHLTPVTAGLVGLPIIGIIIRRRIERL